MKNAIPSGIDEVVLVLNVILAAAAVDWNLAAARVAPTRSMRVVRVAVASLAGLYAVSYLVLIATEVSVARWSSVMRGVSLVAWLVAWIGPSWAQMRSPVAKRIAEAVAREIEAKR